jgi:FkbM family methyltransferase
MMVRLLKKLLLRRWIKDSRLQLFWRRLHTVATFAMNYAGGSVVEESGEVWVVENVVATACATRRDVVLFDVGANVGDYALMLARHLPGAVYAFEPAPATFGVLTQRAAAHPSIRPFAIAFSDEEGSSELFTYSVDGVEDPCISSIDRRRPTAVLKIDTLAREPIQLRTIDSFCAEHAIAAIDFLKLDVEGHELAVLRGAERMLRSGAISMIQFEFGPANIYSRTFLYDFWELLSGEYDLFRIIPRGIVPITAYGEHLEVFLTTNYLAVRKALHEA